MANQWYPKGKEAVMKKTIDFVNDAMTLYLLRTSAGPNAGGNPVYTYSAAHTTLAASIPNNVYCRASSIAVAVAARVVSNGDFDFTDPQFPVVAAGDAVQAVILVHDATGQLLAYGDSASGTLPLTPDGRAINFNTAGVFGTI